MSSPAEETTYVNARCHCSANQFKIAFPTSKLPLRTDMCHCNACRHITGTLVHTAPMRGQPLDINSSQDDERPADLSNLSKYSASGHLNRYFCSSCGASMLYETHGEVPSPNYAHWSISVGSLERSEGIVEVGYHAYLADTVDGGTAEFYPSVDGEELPRYALEGPETLPIDWQSDKLKEKLEKSTNPAVTEEDSLRCYCHCGRISLSIKRETTLPNAGEWWHVAPKKEGDPIRFIAGFCGCNDCRLSSGSTFMSAFFTTRNNIIDNSTGKPVVLAHDEDRDESKDLFKHYQSSPDIYRDFCPQCGAKVLYYSVKRDGAKVVDIFLGVIDQDQDGVRAERWLSWWPEVMQSKYAVNKTMLKALQDGLKARLQPPSTDVA